jgi:two-component system cell cycle sensor histidine kinase/response regulator CckA
MGDATELLQVLMNLCINARDAMIEPGALTIAAQHTLLDENASHFHPEARPGRYVLLKVSDTGSGMTPDILDRIFDPFFTTKEQGKGTGLGLATVQGIVKSHGGFINVYSEPGTGSTFSVYVPAAVTTESSARVSADSAAETGNGQTLLLVDDEEFVLTVTASALETNGFRVITARDGASAIARFKAHHDEISAVLLDMMMPGLDGLQTLDQMRQIDPDVRVIACSGLRTSQREAEVLERGAKAFLPKPYSEGALLNTLAQVLKSSN